MMEERTFIGNHYRLTETFSQWLLLRFLVPKTYAGKYAGYQKVGYNGSVIDPSKDGVDHINVYSKGKTRLGRMLSNFHAHDIETEDGWFMSVEGYWYWLSASDTEPKRERLRRLYGFDAKKLGREMKAADWPKLDGFRRKIRGAIWAKIDTCPELQKLMAANTLPYRHYYTYGDTDPKVVEPGEGEWILKFIEKAARCVKENG